ncbi:MAG: DUF1887 family protein [Nitrospiraceae bacterium]|nr:DUF1887 family protein [Nitrospiraceae bacterium]
MSNVLVSLVSEQVIPNVLFIEEMKRRKNDVQMYLFVSTELMENKGKTSCIISGSHIEKSKTKTIKVVEDSIEDINCNLMKFSEELSGEDDVIVNLTGGTKIMSIGVYNFFKEMGANIYYLPIGKNICKRMSLTSYQLNFRISLEDYLTSHGIKIASDDINSILKSNEYTKGFFSDFLDNKFDMVSKLGGVINKNGLIDEEAKLFLEEINFGAEENEQLDVDEIKYLTLGGWLEEYTYSLIKEKLQLGENEIGLNIQISHKDSPNELDVMFVLENTLYVVECKTSLSKGMLAKTLYKISALKNNYGLSAKSYVFTLDKNLREPEGTIKEDYKNRASLLGVHLVDRTILSDKTKLDKVFNSIKGGMTNV